MGTRKQAHQSLWRDNKNFFPRRNFNWVLKNEQDLTLIFLKLAKSKTRVKKKKHISASCKSLSIFLLKNNAWLMEKKNIWENTILYIQIIQMY